MQQPEFEIIIDPDRFCHLSKADQHLTVESLSVTEKWKTFRLFKTLDDGGIGWNGHKGVDK